MEQFSYGMEVLKYFHELYGKKTFRQFRRYDELIRRFRKKFQSRFCYIASSPGRVELIGNHTDHNGGKVIGCAVDSDIVAAFLPDSDGKVHIEGNNYRNIEFSLDEISVKESGSVGMVKGVLTALKNRGYVIGGFRAILDTDLKGGAGMSSSAAFELLTATIQNSLYNDSKISADVLAEVGQWAENNYFGKPCGLLDQAVVAVGGTVEMDFSNGFSARRLQNRLSELNLYVVDTGKSHSSLTDYYASIPSEMRAVAEFFGKTRLIDVDEAEFYARSDELKKNLPQRAVLRAEHFFEENHRVKIAARALESGNKEEFIKILNQSGESSIKKLQNCSVGDDFTIADAVIFAKKIFPDCAARVHGGGFQGTILAVAEEGALPLDELTERFGKDSVRVVHVRNVGAKVL